MKQKMKTDNEAENETENETEKKKMQIKVQKLNVLDILDSAPFRKCVPLALLLSTW